MRKAIAGSFVFFAFIMINQDRAFSEDGYYGNCPRYSADNVIVNRPVNMQGLTGLLFTNSAYTQPEGSFTFALAGLAENSEDPDYSFAQGTASFTLGLTDRIEAAVRAKMYGTNLGSSLSREIGVGDTDLLLKWRISSQGQTIPAFAIGFGLTLPTGNDDKGFSEIKYESLKLMAIATGENRVLDDDFFVGVYMEAQAVFNDQLHEDEKSLYKEKYGVINAGILFPLNSDNSLQFILEYTSVLKRDRTMIYDGNYTGVAPGLRYVSDDFNITLGVQKMSRDDAGTAVDDDGIRYAGTMSYRF